MAGRRNSFRRFSSCLACENGGMCAVWPFNRKLGHGGILLSLNKLLTSSFLNIPELVSSLISQFLHRVAPSTFMKGESTLTPGVPSPMRLASSHYFPDESEHPWLPWPQHQRNLGRDPQRRVNHSVLWCLDLLHTTCTKVSEGFPMQAPCLEMEYFFSLYKPI